MLLVQVMGNDAIFFVVMMARARAKMNQLKAVTHFQISPTPKALQAASLPVI